jgi:hypothetical protein
MTRLCYDYDTIKYVVGYASENRYIIATNKITGNSLTLKNRTALKEHLDSFNINRDSPLLITEFDIQDVQEAMSADVVSKILNTTITNIVKHLQAKEYYGYVGRGKVFRHDVAKIRPYKGGRSSLKPVNLPLIEEMLLERFNGKIATDNLEADDWLAIDSYSAWKDWSKTRHQKDRLIVVTEDKDALQCGGSHLFNPTKMTLPFTIKNELGEVSLREDTKAKTITGWGRKFLYAQMLLGDTVDCYTPTALVAKDNTHKRFGDVSCFNLLNKLNTDEECLKAIVEQYKLWYPTPVTFASHNGNTYTYTWSDVANEIWALARMKRWIGDDVTFGEVLNKFGIS